MSVNKISLVEIKRNLININMKLFRVNINKIITIHITITEF